MKIVNKIVSVLIILTFLLPLVADARAGYRASSGGGYRSGSGGSYRSRTYQGGGYGYRPQQSPYNQRQSNSYQSPYAAAPARQTGSFFSGLASGLLGAWLYSKIFNTPTANNAQGTENKATTQQPKADNSWGIGRILLVLIIVYIVWRLMRRRDRVGSKPRSPQVYENQPFNISRQEPMANTLSPDDHHSFERLLQDIQQAWSDYDLNALRRLTTASMYNHFAGIIEDNRRQGIKNQVSQLKLLNQEVEDTWQEGNTHYAAVALTWSAIDYAVNESLSPSDPGYLVEGNIDQPSTITEIWTFEKSGNRDWILAEINQA